MSSTEYRSMLKNLLYNSLRADDVDEIISCIKASMETDDISVIIGQYEEDKKRKSEKIKTNEIHQN